MKSLFFLLFLLGWTLIIMGYVSSYNTCPPKEVEYRYIPRNLMDEQLAENNSEVSSLYDKMTQFKDPLS